MRATEEFKRLERKSQLTGEDLMAWGAMLCKMEKCAGEQAFLFLKRALEKAKNTDEMLYFRIYEQIIDLQVANGNVDATVRELQRKITGGKKSSEQYALLLYALNKSKKYIECYEMFLKAIEIFPGDWRILTMGGDICWNLEKREDAFKSWNKAIKLNGEWDAAKYSKAFAYEELGEKEKHTTYGWRLSVLCDESTGISKPTRWKKEREYCIKNGESACCACEGSRCLSDGGS